MRYVGLTDDPEALRRQYGIPSDWWQRSFHSEEEARQWMSSLVELPNFIADGLSDGWCYGYTFTLPATSPL